jgi:hypothetical protein
VLLVSRHDDHSGGCARRTDRDPFTITLPRIAVQPAVDRGSQQRRCDTAEAAQVLKLAVGIMRSPGAAERVDPQQPRAHQAKRDTSRTRRGSDVGQSLFGKREISGFDEHAQVRDQGDDLHEPMACCLGLDEQFAGSLTGGEHIPSSDQYSNQNGADRCARLVIIRVQNPGGRPVSSDEARPQHHGRRLRYPPLPEEYSCERGLGSRAFDVGERTGNDGRATQ